MFNNDQSFLTMPDLYKILECPEDASPEIIKKQYRKLSLIHHPDKNLSDRTAAEEKFKHINMAYQVLSDPTTKMKYDNRHNEPDMQHGNGMNNPSNMDDIIKMFFSSNSTNPFGGRVPFHVNMNGNPRGNVHLFRNGQQVHMNMRPNDNGKPPVMQKRVNISFDTAYHGGQIPIDIERSISEVSFEEATNEENTETDAHVPKGKKEIRKTENETVYVEIPKGIDTNEVITIEGKGNAKEGVYGDVRVVIVVDNHEEFKREGLNLIYEKRITFKESVCGFESIIKHINGKQLRYKSETGQVVRDGTVKTIQGLGMMRNNHVGSLIIKLHVDYSCKLSLEQIKKLNHVL